MAIGSINRFLKVSNVLVSASQAVPLSAYSCSFSDSSCHMFTVSLEGESLVEINTKTLEALHCVNDFYRNRNLSC